MASHAIRSRRRPVRASAPVVKASSGSSLAASVSRIALSRPARAAYFVLGTAGLAAIAVALVGPKRIEREVLKPLRGRPRAPGGEALGGRQAAARSDRRSL
jgi:hypothetical protein